MGMVAREQEAGGLKMPKGTSGILGRLWLSQHNRVQQTLPAEKVGDGEPGLASGVTAY